MVIAARPLRFGLGLLIAAQLIACTGGLSQSSSAGVAPQYTVGGSVSGLTGSGLVVQNSTGESLSISADGPFTFHTTLTTGTTYYVLAAQQPVSPTQTCVVGNPTGTVASVNVSNVNIVCTDKSDMAADAIGVTTTGITGSGLVLQNNGGDNLAVSADGSFTFTVTVPAGSQYAVSVLSPPINPYQDCVVSNGSGTTTGSDVANVVVSCTVNNNPTHTISGTITGVSGSIVLQDNGRDDLTVSADGSFQFPLKIPQGSVYDVSTKTVAGAQSQTCQFQNARGIVGAQDITNIVLTCDANPSLEVAVSGLSGTGLLLQNNGSDNLSVTSNGTTAFPTPLLPGGTYAVTVAVQPSNPSQTCAVTNGTGRTGPGATATVTCTTDQFAVGGSVTGLPDPTTGATIDLVLQNNLGDDVTIPVTSQSPTTFTFPTSIASGSQYSVTVKRQPGTDTSHGQPGVTQTSTVCVVSGGAGTVTTGPVNNITVNCVRPLGFAYVTNGTDNTVTPYLVDSATGLLLASGAPVPTDTGPACAASFYRPPYYIFYVCNKTANDLSAYTIDSNTGALTQAIGSPVSVGLSAPTSIALTPYTGGTLALYVTSSSAGPAQSSAAAFSVGSNPAMLTSINQVPTGTGPIAGLTYLPRAGSASAPNYYVVPNSGSNSLSLFQIDGATGALTSAQSGVATGQGPHDIRYNFGFNVTTGLSYDALYVANSGDGTISTYTADPTTELLAQQGTAVNVGAGLDSLASVLGAYLYATASRGLVIFTYATDGSLNPTPDNQLAAGAGPGPLAVLQNQYAYVVNRTDETISVFSIDVEGLVAPVATNTPITTGHGPTSIVVIPRPDYTGG